MQRLRRQMLAGDGALRWRRYERSVSEVSEAIFDCTGAKRQSKKVKMIMLAFIIMQSSAYKLESKIIDDSKREVCW